MNLWKNNMHQGFGSGRDVKRVKRLIETRALAAHASPTPPNPFGPKFTILACCVAAYIVISQSRDPPNSGSIYWPTRERYINWDVSQKVWSVRH